LGLQQGWPSPPQAEHIVMSVMRHEAWVAVHDWLAQQG
jgi:hypothetical protein